MEKSQLALIQVLIVDDERTILRIVYDVLIRLGFRAVTAAYNVPQAIDLVTQKPFDLVISDWQMGELSGIDLVQFIRRSPLSTCPRVPIIMLTGNTEAHYVLRARDAGINEYIIKPFSSEQLVKRIRMIIERPKPFIVSMSYAGPERRYGDKPLSQGSDRRNPKKK